MYGKPMTSGSPLKHILLFSAPVLLGSLLQQLYGVVDSFVVGNYSGQDSLSAVGTTVPFSFLFLAIAMGFSIGNGILVSQSYGANDEEKVRSSAAVGILLLFGMGIAATLVGFAVARPAFVWYVRTPEEILGLTLQYFYVYLIGLVFQFGYNIFAATLRAVGDGASTLYFLVVSTLVNVALDFLFVAVFRWGVVGAAAATDVAQAVSCFCAWIYMDRKYPVFRFRLRDYRWDWGVAKRTLVVGTPAFLHLAIVSIGVTVLQRGVNGFGKVMIASYAVGRQFELFLNFPSHALQTALATFTGQNVGAGKLDRVKQGTCQTALASLGFTFFISVFLYSQAGFFASCFALDETATGYCVRHIRAITIINLVLSCYLPVFGTFQGTGHSGIPALVATSALALRCLAMHFFGHSPFLGYTVVWWNGIFGFGVGFLITWGYYFSGLWKRGLVAKRERAN
ncbi:MAG: MATE family efflux transporter [Thermoguttaceae bacterium]|nr:MATE family efflux transporter [Thermoguttaceae bacterium]